MKMKGFTLVEMMSAVAIIGIMASIAISTTYYFRQKSFENTVEQDVRNAGSLCEAYYVENMSYPAFGPFTGKEGTTSYNIADGLSIKLSQNVTLEGVIQGNGSIVITGSHPGSTNPITYSSELGVRR